MAVNILLPTPLRRYAEGREEVAVEADSVGSALRALIDNSPQLGTHLFDPKGQIRSFVNVYLNDEDTRYLQGEQTPLKDGDALTIVPSIAGG